MRVRDANSLGFGQGSRLFACSNLQVRVLKHVCANLNCNTPSSSSSSRAVEAAISQGRVPVPDSSGALVMSGACVRARGAAGTRLLAQCNPSALRLVHSCVDAEVCDALRVPAVEDVVRGRLAYILASPLCVSLLPYIFVCVARSG